MNANILTAES